MSKLSPERKQQILVVASMYVGYACFMILRMIPTVVGNDILDDPSLDVALPAWGKILTAGTCGGILGKILGGWLADRLGGKLTFTLGLAVTSVAVVVFAAGFHVQFFAATFFVALMAKSSGWPAMAKLIGHWFQPNEYGRVWGIVSTSSRVGTIIAMYFLGRLLVVLSWRWLLLVSGGIAGVVVLWCALMLRERPAKSSVSDDDLVESEDRRDAPHFLDGTTLPQAISRFAASPRFWLITGSLMGLTILWDFLLFVSIYLKQTLNISAAEASMAAAAFPAGSLISVLVGGYVFDKLSRAKMAVLMGGLLTLATGCVLSFYLMPNWNLDPKTAGDLSVALLFVFGLCVSPCYYIPMSVFSIEFGGIHSGFLIALLDVFGFGASAVFSYFAGGWADQSWSLFYAVLLAVAVWSLLTTFCFLLNESRYQTNAPEQTDGGD